MNYKTTGVCARTIDIEMDGTKVKNVSFNGGCNGNGKGISALVVGMEADEVIKRCKGIKCGMKNTSCPDRLAKALEKYLADK
ncbi:MAG: TIGR03905 family TSCPD domain-containing protein [Acutalibacteraceae bacterium]|nr:TIGR03905 family TSCPD domain-containing protein [Acutalibacteraceae bacterium]